MLGGPVAGKKIKNNCWTHRHPHHERISLWAVGGRPALDRRSPAIETQVILDASKTLECSNIYLRAKWTHIPIAHRCGQSAVARMGPQTARAGPPSARIGGRKRSRPAGRPPGGRITHAGVRNTQWGHPPITGVKQVKNTSRPKPWKWPTAPIW